MTKEIFPSSKQPYRFVRLHALEQIAIKLLNFVLVLPYVAKAFASNFYTSSSLKEFLKIFMFSVIIDTY